MTVTSFPSDLHCNPSSTHHPRLVHCQLFPHGHQRPAPRRAIRRKPRRRLDERVKAGTAKTSTRVVGVVAYYRKYYCYTRRCGCGRWYILEKGALRVGDQPNNQSQHCPKQTCTVMYVYSTTLCTVQDAPRVSTRVSLDITLHSHARPRLSLWSLSRLDCSVSTCRAVYTYFPYSISILFRA